MMATVSKWTPFEVALDITATAGTVTRISATQFTVKINASWETYYDGAQTNFGMTASSGGGSVNLNTFGTKSSSGSGSFTGTYSISGNGSATKTITVTFKNYEEDWQGNVTQSATKTVSFDVTVPAWTSYTISYNANGGSGIPSNQTKWKDQTLTLSSTKPTRTGYKFSKWNTKSDGSGTSYSSGSSYTANAAATLYAIWTENALTVNYYSNYATSAFDDATNAVSADKNVLVKTYNFYYDDDHSTHGLHNYSNSNGSMYMTRTGYTGTGYWGTSTNGGTLINENTGFSSGQAIAEALGKSLKTGNASVNLYAQWEVNVLTIKYNINGGSVNSDKYYVSDGLISLVSSSSVLEDKWDYNSGHENGLYNASTFGLTREGYKFIGWKVGSSGTIVFDQDDASVMPTDLASNLTTGDRTVTLYAVWEISGVVYIDNGTILEPYLIYIDNGTSWDLHLAYVDNGTDWVIIS